MRYWLAAGGINPEQDVSDCGAATADGTKRESRQHGTFCVGEPWPAQTVTQGITQPSQLVNSGKISEKALTMRADCRQNPKAAKAILMAVQEAQQWSAKTENKEESQDRRQTPVVEGGRERYRAIPG